VLWSGTAYASTPRTVEAPRLAGPVGGVLQGPAPTPLPLAPLPKPAAPQHIVKPVVDALPPVVQHTLTRVHDVVPPAVSSILPAPRASHAPSHVVAQPAAHTTAVRPHVAVTARHPQHVAHRAPATKPAHAVRALTHAPARTAHHRSASSFPVGADDAPSGSTSTGLGSPFAIATHDGCDSLGGWSHVAFEAAREPAMVVLRDIARPG
jgi:hypothetical protein